LLQYILSSNQSRKTFIWIKGNKTVSKWKILAKGPVFALIYWPNYDFHSWASEIRRLCNLSIIHYGHYYVTMCVGCRPVLYWLRNPDQQTTSWTFLLVEQWNRTYRNEKLELTFHWLFLFVVYGTKQLKKGTHYKINIC